jgi:acetyl-CoA carboxylase biotin carboxylase subunit
MVAKLIAWGDTREQAIQRLNRALDEFTLTGIKTNIPLHKTILEHKKFLDGSYTTQFIEKDFGDLKDLFKHLDDRVFLISAAIEAYNQYKNRGSWKHNQLPSKWKDSGRQKSVRS